MTSILYDKCLTFKPRSASPMPTLRDKRYENPVLAIDLFEMTVKSKVWSSAYFVITDDAGSLAVGRRFYGSVATADGMKSGTFEAKVVDVDPETKWVLASIEWCSRDAAMLFRKPDRIQADGRLPPPLTIAVAIPRRTINWSLSGLLIEYDGDDIVQGDRVVGTLVGAEGNAPGTFTAVVVRASSETNFMALKFTAISDTMFDALEYAIRKFPAAQRRSG